MSYAIRKDGQGWRAINSAEDVTEEETFSEVQPPIPSPDPIQIFTQEIQKRLDTFAQTRNYDGILSACTYATSTAPKFKAEGQYAVEARDNTWVAAYALMAEVEAGSRPMPSGYADIEPLLPVLEWPV